MRRISPLTLILALAACGPETYAEGAICPAPEVLAGFADGDDLDVVIMFDDCPPGCGGETQVECSVHRQGSTIDIDATGYLHKRGGSCAAVCRPLSVTCTVGDLAAGTYTIHSGSHSLEVTIPSDDPPAYEPTCGY